MNALRRMDPLTHGLLGLAIGSLRRPDPNRRAVLLGSLFAAGLPDLDYLWPAADPVLHTLRAHRGVSHSLFFAPLVALGATGLAKLFVRDARWRAVYPWALAATVLAHLLADAWTGWGTRLFLPFSSERVTLDWMMVLDPLFTAPLLIGALWGIRRRALLRTPLLVGLAASCVYLVTRIAVQRTIEGGVRDHYPSAESIHVFPSWIGPMRWRYVAVGSEHYAVGAARLGSAPEEQARHPRSAATPSSAPARANPTVREALAWARFPLLREEPGARGGVHVDIADLRYHLNGEPTLRFRIDLDAQGAVLAATLHRGGSARSLLERFRKE